MQWLYFIHFLLVKEKSKVKGQRGKNNCFISKEYLCILIIII